MVCIRSLKHAGMQGVLNVFVGFAGITNVFSDETHADARRHPCARGFSPKLLYF